MKRSLLALGLILMLATSAFAIDGAEGIGQGASKIEAGYVGGGIGLNYNFGLSRDWTVYGALLTTSGGMGFGAGTKYAVLNEKKGDSVSLAPKLDLLLMSGGMLPVPGLVVSKKLDSKMTVLGEFQTYSMSGSGYSLGMTWIGGGVLYNLSQQLQLAGELGIATVTAKVLGMNYTASGMGFALGLNYTL